MPLAEAGPTESNPYASKMPRLLDGCSAFSYGKLLSSGQMTLEEFIQKAVELRLQAVDLTTYYLKSTDPAYLNNLRHLAYQNAVVISGVSCGVRMVDPNPEKRAGSLSEIGKWVDVTEQLGASRLRVMAGRVPNGTTVQQAIDWVVETMKGATDYSGLKGITLAMENQAGASESADLCLEVMHRVNSPYAGLNLDVTHFVPTPAQDAYAQIGSCIPYAATTHIGNEFDDRTPIDLDRVWQLFAERGFKGYMTAEYVGKSAEDQTLNVPKLVGEIQALCKKYSTV